MAMTLEALRLLPFLRSAWQVARRAWAELRQAPCGSGKCLRHKGKACIMRGSLCPTAVGPAAGHAISGRPLPA